MRDARALRQSQASVRGRRGAFVREARVAGVELSTAECALEQRVTGVSHDRSLGGFRIAVRSGGLSPVLWMEAVAAGHGSPMWMTYRQALALSGQVRKGVRGCRVVYFGTLADGSADGGAAEGRVEEEGACKLRFLKTYNVFNVPRSTACRSGSRRRRPSPLPSPRPSASPTQTGFWARWGSRFATGAAKPSTRLARTGYNFRRWRLSTISRATTRPGDTRRFTRRAAYWVWRERAPLGGWRGWPRRRR